MGLPKIQIIEENGALGLTAASQDAIAGLVYSGVAVANKIALLEPKQIFSTQQAKSLGLDAAYDTANDTKVWKNIQDFYAQAGEGAALWVMLYNPTTLMANMTDVANNLVKKLLDTAQGAVRFWAIGRVPPSSYSPTYAAELDPDVNNAIGNAHALCKHFADNFTPCRAIIDARDFQGNVGSVLNLKGNTNNRAQALIATDEMGSKNASIGLLLGKYANIPVQRNPGRVKDGDLNIGAGYLTNGTTAVESLNGAGDQLTDKGYCFLRKFPGKNGYFFTDDPTATAATDDYSSFARGRVIDKAIRVAYATFIEEILDDVEVDEQGFVEPVILKGYQAKIERALAQLLNSDVDPKDQNVSHVRAVIDPKQNLISTGKLAVQIKITPVAYTKEIIINLGFENPALTP